jgi:hypothetical protein
LLINQSNALLNDVVASQDGWLLLFVFAATEGEGFAPEGPEEGAISRNGRYACSK